MRKNLNLLFILIGLTIVSGVVWYFYGEDSSTLSKNPLANFAIEDTATVTKIFITDANGQRVLLERDENSRYWDLNGKYKARKDAVDLLLKTFKRIKVKSPVPSTAKENMLKLMQTGKSVEIYTGGDQPAKTYIVGTPTSDHTGTYMVLETPEEGRSSEPFITHMEGFTGFLSTRFFTDEEEWRYTGIFDYPNLEDIQKVEVIHHNEENRSFDIHFNGESDLVLHSRLLDIDIPQFDTLAVKDYFIRYKKVHLETYQSHMTPEAEDSLLNSQAAFTLRVLERSGKTKKIDVYYKPALVQQVIDDSGEIYPYDTARMYGVVNGDDVVLIQTYVFDPLLVGLESFIVK
ncbi:MAG: hypothetical protein P8N19_03015 [Flavobacteriales bacterium]|nr:hypothetical protein [Flavobacteriales bacterium]